MGRIPRVPAKAPQAVTERVNSGPVAGQLVMGVKDLARGQIIDKGFTRTPSSRMPGAMKIVSAGSEEHHYEVDPHGYVQEGFGTSPHHDKVSGGVLGGAHPSAADLYGTHGGRYAHTIRESIDKESPGETPSGLGYDTQSVRHHDSQVRDVKKHWRSQPLVQFPTSELVHSTQPHTETEGDPTDWTKLRTAGGRTQRDPRGNPMGMEKPGSEEGRLRIEAIKADLAKGGKIRKPIWMTKVNGRYFQLDGHHRMVAAREMGLSHVPVRMWDQDAAAEQGMKAPLSFGAVPPPNPDWRAGAYKSS